MANKIQLRRGQKSAMPTLSSGEPAYATDTRELFIGTGSGNVNMGGNHWYRGTAMSGTSTTTNAYSYSACPQVKLGDLYLNTSNGNVYACTTAGSGSSAKWTYQGCIKGATGATGPMAEGPTWEQTGPTDYATPDNVTFCGGVWFNNGMNFNANGYVSMDEVTEDAAKAYKLFTYSSTPVQVGTWIDGKPIYRIAFKGSGLTKVTAGTYKDMYRLNLHGIIQNAKGNLNYDPDYIGLINHYIVSHHDTLGDNIHHAEFGVQRDSAYLKYPSYYGYVEFVVDMVDSI